ATRPRGSALAWIGVALGVFILGLGGCLLWLLGGGKGKGPDAGAPGKPAAQKRPRDKGAQGERPLAGVVPRKDEEVGEVRRSEPLGGEVRRLAWSSDGKRLLAACWDRTLYLYDVPSLAAPQALKGHTDGVNAAVFLPTKGQVMSVGAD